MPHKLAVITVVYQNYTILTDYFASFDKQTHDHFHVYVADLSEKKEHFDYPHYAKAVAGDNRGYAHGINIATRQAIKDGCDMFCITNCDITVREDFIENTIKSVEGHPTSLIGGKIYYAPGYEYHKEKYLKHDLGKVIWYAGGINDWKNCITKHRGVDKLDEGQYDSFGKTDFITGCLMCYNKEALDMIGDWDESYFLYYEDADLCERAKRVGLPIYYDPSIVIWHKNAASTGGSGSTIHQEYQKKNRLKYGLKYAPYKTRLHLMKNYIMDYLNSICKCDE